MLQGKGSVSSWAGVYQEDNLPMTSWWCRNLSFLHSFLIISVPLNRCSLVNFLQLFTQESETDPSTRAEYNAVQLEQTCSIYRQFSLVGQNSQRYNTVPWRHKLIHAIMHKYLIGGHECAFQSPSPCHPLGGGEKRRMTFQTTLKENMNFGIELCRLVYPR